MTQSLIHAILEHDENKSLQTILATKDDAEQEFFLEVNLNYQDKMKQKIKLFSILPSIERTSWINFKIYMEKSTVANTNRKKTLICVWLAKINHHCFYSSL